MRLFSSLGQPLAGSLLLLALLGKTIATLAQSAPATHNRWHVAPGTQVYLDGRPSTTTAINQLDEAAIKSVEGMGPDDKYLVVTTQLNASSPAVLALADKLHLSSAYATRPAPLRAIAPPALAYITSHYPKAWLGGEVLAMTRKSTGAVKYRVQLADNWGWRYVSFTEAGELVDSGGY